MIDTRETNAAVNACAGEHAGPRLFIDGRFREADSGPRFDSLSPTTGAVVGSTAAGGADDMYVAIRAARKVFDEDSWAIDREWASGACSDCYGLPMTARTDCPVWCSPRRPIAGWASAARSGPAR